jgi:hypothetical protein
MTNEQMTRKSKALMTKRKMPLLKAVAGSCGFGVRCRAFDARLLGRSKFLMLNELDRNSKFEI